MRRNSRMKDTNKNLTDKILIYSSIAVAIIALMLIGVFLYSRNLNNNVRKGTMTLEQMASISNNTSKEETQSASTEIGKSVNEVEQNAIENTNITNAEATNEASTENTTLNVANENAKSNSNNINTVATTNNSNSSKTTEAKRELSFAMPVDGEIVKEFVKDSLVYSVTLEEWVTHLGIDIKAEKTAIVKAAEEGTVKSIKNDPRYGLTIVIEHTDGYQTVYANLLSSEFVVEGEMVKKGQTIGTVGNTATFESVDDPHLHFEILKDSVQIDPSIYLK